MADETQQDDDAKTTGKTDGDKGTDKTSTPDPNAALQAQLDRFGGQLTELKQTVGRAQSVADKAATREPDPALQGQLNSVTAVLDELVAGIDQEALPADVRAKIASVRAAALAESSRQAIVAEVTQTVRKELGAPDASTPVPGLDPTALATLEAKVNVQITESGLDPGDKMFDWAEYARIVRDNPTGADLALTRVVSATIATALRADPADAERDKKIEESSSNPQGGTVQGTELSDVLNDDTVSLDDKRDALMRAIK